jgi:hypothetical protein
VQALFEAVAPERPGAADAPAVATPLPSIDVAARVRALF